MLQNRSEVAAREFDAEVVKEDSKLYSKLLLPNI